MPSLRILLLALSVLAVGGDLQRSASEMANEVRPRKRVSMARKFQTLLAVSPESDQHILSEYIAGDTLTFVMKWLGWAGVASSMLLWFSPLSTVKQIIENGSASGFSVAPLISTLVSCALWVSYAYWTPDRLQLGCSSGTGMVTSLIWISIFAYYSDKLPIILQVIGSMIPVGLANYLVANEYLPSWSPDGPFFLGAISSAMYVVMLASPTEAVLNVIHTKSTKYMPISMVCCGACTGTVWTLYGFLAMDTWFFLSSILGALSSYLNIAVWVVYSRYEQEAMSDEEKPLVNKGKECPE
jgi:uncharacterized protein with PQ loop repeat